MKLSIILAILLIAIVGYLILQNSPSGPAIKTNHTISGNQGLLLNEQDLQELGMTQVWNETECQTQKYTTMDMHQIEYNICNYTINNLSDTWVVIELKKFANPEDLNNTYLYESSHLFSPQGIISVNDYGDQSLFRVNNPNDYMGHLNEPGVYYYHLWICKNEYLIHITSRGRSKEAGEYVTKIGEQILSKFG